MTNLDIESAATAQFASVVDDSFRKYDPSTCLVTLCGVLSHPSVDTKMFSLRGATQQEIDIVIEYCTDIACYLVTPLAVLDDVKLPIVGNKDLVDWLQDNVVCDNNPYLPRTLVELFRNLVDGIDEQFSTTEESTLDFRVLDIDTIDDTIGKLVRFMRTDEFYNYYTQKLV